MSDVDHGGSTVFLHPRLAVKPVKRSAVFWYNLLPTGAGDTRTRHGACPVSVGIKWGEYLLLLLDLFLGMWETDNYFGLQKVEYSFSKLFV